MIANPFNSTFQVPATRGRMGATEYYTATLPFGAVTKLFTFDPYKTMELLLVHGPSTSPSLTGASTFWNPPVVHMTVSECRSDGSRAP